MIKFWAGATACLVGLCAGYGLAARNASGTFAKLYTFSPGSVINSANMNSQFSDFETEMSDSLSRSGKGGMTAALRGSDGTVTAPAFAFTSETGTGLYRIGSSDLGLSINQTKTGEWTANGYRTANGAVGTPSLSFFNDTGGGLYRIGSNDFGFAVNGAKVQEWTTAGAAITGTLTTSGLVGFGGASAPSAGDPQAQFGTSFPVYIRNPALGFNDYYNGSSDTRAVTGYSGDVWFNTSDGSINLRTAGTGAAGNITNTTRMSVGTSGITGNGGSTVTAWSHGGCTLNGASPAVCTATIVSGQICGVSYAGTTAAPTNGIRASNSAGTVTFTGVNGQTDGINYVCF